jgi:hypothetical protein
VPNVNLNGEEAKVVRVEGGEVVATLTVVLDAGDFRLARRPSV